MVPCFLSYAADFSYIYFSHDKNVRILNGPYTHNEIIILLFVYGPTFASILSNGSGTADACRSSMKMTHSATNTLAVVEVCDTGAG